MVGFTEPMVLFTDWNQIFKDPTPLTRARISPKCRKIKVTQTLQKIYKKACKPRYLVLPLHYHIEAHSPLHSGL